MILIKEKKRIIIKENSNRIFDKGVISPELTSKEKEALLKIILEYERARDFLRWFLDFDKFPDSLSFNIFEFKNEAKETLIPKQFRCMQEDKAGRLWIGTQGTGLLTIEDYYVGKIQYKQYNNIDIKYTIAINAEGILTSFERLLAMVFKQIYKYTFPLKLGN